MPTGKDIATAAFADFESFFEPSASFAVRQEFDAQILPHALYRGSGERSRICLSPDFCGKEHETPVEFIFSLLILSHELAHYVNSHNSHQDQPGDSPAIESRADNQGGQICMALLVFGGQVNGLLKPLEPAEAATDSTVRLKELGEAIGMLHRNLFEHETGSRYPQPIYRTMSILAGLVSFYFRLRGSLNEDFIMTVLLVLQRGAGIDGTTIPTTLVEDAAPLLERLDEIHRKLQTVDPLQLEGFKPHIGRILGGDYRSPAEQIAAHRKKLEAMIEDFQIVREHKSNGGGEPSGAA